MMIDLLRQRLQAGDRIRVNQRARKGYLHGRMGKVLRYTNVEVEVDGTVHNITPASLDVLEPQ